MKTTICLLAAVAVLLISAACNNNAPEPDVSDAPPSTTGPAEVVADPYPGMWDAVSISAHGITMGAEDAFTRETSLNLREDGTAVVMIDGERFSGDWSIIGGIARINTEDENFVGLIDHTNGVLVLALPSHGMDVNFAHRDGNLVPRPPEPVPEPPPGGWRSDDPLVWWDGEWYGYISVSGLLEDGETLEYTLDCYGISRDIFDGEKFIYLWDYGLVIGRPTFMVDYDGSTDPRGRAVAHSGMVFETSIEPGDWTADLQHSPYKDQFIISVSGDLGDGSAVDYQIVLRPWGMLWDDVPLSGRPPGYEKYLELYRDTLDDAGIPDTQDY